MFRAHKADHKADHKIAEALMFRMMPPLCTPCDHPELITRRTHADHTVDHKLITRQLSQPNIAIAMSP